MTIRLITARLNRTTSQAVFLRTRCCDSKKFTVAVYRLSVGDLWLIRQNETLGAACIAALSSNSSKPASFA